MKKSIHSLLLAIFLIGIATAQNCNLQWKVKCSFIPHQFITDSLGNSYAIAGKDSTTLLITKYSEAGSIIWEKNHQFTGGTGLINVQSAKLDQDYNLFICGTYKTPAKNAGIYVAKYTPPGNLASFDLHDNQGYNSNIISVTLKPGNLFITAQSDDNILFLINYYTAGSLLTVTKNSFPDPHAGKFSSIKSMSDDANNLYLLTSLRATDSTFVTLHKYTKNGVAEWRKLNFKGIAYHEPKNLDFYVTSSGTSYIAFNKKNPIKSDTINVTGYNTTGNIEFNHNHNFRTQSMGDILPSYNSQLTNLAIYGNETNYILHTIASVFEYPPTSFFIQYNKDGSIKWKQTSLTKITCNFRLYEQNKHRLLCSGTYIDNNESPAIYEPTFLILNTSTGQTSSVSSNNYMGHDFLVTKANSVFWLIAEGFYHVSKLMLQTGQPVVQCKNFLTPQASGLAPFKIQTDKFENLYAAYSKLFQDTVYIEKYSTRLSVNEKKGLRISIAVYPNPANNLLTISSAQLNVFKTLQVFNNLGQVVYTQQLQAEGLTEYTISIKDLPAGIYFVSLANDETQVSKVFIKAAY